ncbi:MAG: nitroreductase family protein, partial [Caldilineaceae bacterium]|nr:nitroreductase family protein [Caldilineaceae bacterium]
MHRHGSVRQFTAEPVPRALVETIVQAAQRASTSSNLQMFSAVAVT